MHAFIYSFIYYLFIFSIQILKTALSPNSSNWVAFENILIFTNKVVTVQINDSTTKYKVGESQHWDVFILNGTKLLQHENTQLTLLYPLRFICYKLFSFWNVFSSFGQGCSSLAVIYALVHVGRGHVRAYSVLNTSSFMLPLRLLS